MQKITTKDIILLQLIVIIYTVNGVLAKLSTGQEVMSLGFIAFYAGEVCVLGIYAILWQQMIKKFQLSVAYANRAMALLWSLLWSIVFFHETPTINNGIGVALVLIGTIIVNTDKDSKGDSEQSEDNAADTDTIASSVATDEQKEVQP